MHAVGFSSTKFQTKPTKKRGKKNRQTAVFAMWGVLLFLSPQHVKRRPCRFLSFFIFFFSSLFSYYILLLTSLHCTLVFFFSVFAWRYRSFFFFGDLSLNAFFFCRMFRCPWLLFFVFTLLTNLLGPPSREKGQKKREKRGVVGRASALLSVVAAIEASVTLLSKRSCV